MWTKTRSPTLRNEEITSGRWDCKSKFALWFLWSITYWKAEENLSLSEIAQEFGISRQAVHDTLKKAEQALEDYENKLNLIDKLVKTEEAIAEIDREIEELASETKDSQTVEKLAKIKSIIDSLEG